MRQSEWALGAQAAAPSSSSNMAWNGSEARATRHTKRSPRCSREMSRSVSSSVTAALWGEGGVSLVANKRGRLIDNRERGTEDEDS